MAARAGSRLGAGLEGRDVFALAQTKDGTVVAGTNDGIFILDPPAADSGNATNSGGAPGSGEASGPAGAALAGSALTWEPRNTIANTIVKTFTETHYHTKVNIEKEVKAPQIEMSGRVNALDVSGDTWAAATDIGVLTSHDQGATWQGGPVMGGAQYRSIAVHGDAIVAARTDGAAISTDQWPDLAPTGRSHHAHPDSRVPCFRPTERSGWPPARASTTATTWAKPGSGFSGCPSAMWTT